MTNATETLTPKPERTPATYRRDLLLARLVIRQLRDDALETGTPFHLGNLALDAEGLDVLWDATNIVLMKGHDWVSELSDSTINAANPYLFRLSL